MSLSKSNVSYDHFGVAQVAPPPNTQDSLRTSARWEVVYFTFALGTLRNQLYAILHPPLLLHLPPHASLRPQLLGDSQSSCSMGTTGKVQSTSCRRVQPLLQSLVGLEGTKTTKIGSMTCTAGIDSHVHAQLTDTNLPLSSRSCASVVDLSCRALLRVASRSDSSSIMVSLSASRSVN